MSDPLDSARQALLGKFLVLSRERITSLNNALVQLEQEPGDEETRRLALREIHTVKGESRLMGFPRMAEVAHRTEDLILRARDLGFVVPAELSDAMMRGLDLLTELLNAPEGSPESEAFSGEVTALLERVGTGQGPGAGAPAAPTPPPAPAPAPTPPPAPAPAPTPPAAAAPAPTGPAAGPEAPPADGGGLLARGKKRSAASDLAAERDEQSIRVGLGRLDRLNDHVGELTLHQAQTGDVFERIGRLGEQARPVLQRLRQLAAALQLGGERAAGPVAGRVGGDRDSIATALAELGELHRELDGLALRGRESALLSANVLDEVGLALKQLRLVPLRSVFAPFPREIRDLARAQDKLVRVEVAGGNLEVDKQVLEALGDPLLHLVRNAVDHGIELPDERRQAGKPMAATIRLSARQVRRGVQITVSDDGRGIDAERVRAKAIQRGIVDAATAAEMTRDDVVALLFRSGFSTRDQVTDVSGRGIGLDVVAQSVERLGGSVGVVVGELGRGTAVELTVPTFVAVTSALLLEAASGQFAIPSPQVDVITEAHTSQWLRAGEGWALRLEEGADPVPLYDLVTLLARRPADELAPLERVVVVRDGGRRLAVLVDRVIGERAIVHRPLDPFLQPLRVYTGTSVSADGGVVLTVNVAELFRRAHHAATTRRAPVPHEEAAAPLVLLVDDSEVTRDMLERAVRLAGYRTMEAANGRDALVMMQQELPDMVLTDLEMPLLDGFGLIGAVRDDPRLGAVPICVLSSLGSDHDKRRAAELGADAYLVKTEFDQGSLLRMIERLLGSAP